VDVKEEAGATTGVDVWEGTVDDGLDDAGGFEPC
jgi:hypothetical protein